MASLCDATLVRWPLDAVAKDRVALPWGVTLRPLAEADASSSGSEGGDDNGRLGVARPPSARRPVPERLVARCDHCLGWIHRGCGFDPDGWTCGLCGGRCDWGVDDARRRRYGASAARRRRPELRPGVADVWCGRRGPDGGARAAVSQPTLLLLVDVSGGPTWLRVVRRAVRRALTSAPPGTLAAVVTFGRAAGLHAPGWGGVGGGGILSALATDRPRPADAPGAASRYVRLSLDDDPTAPPAEVPLSHAYSLEALLTPAGSAACRAAAESGREKERGASGVGALVARPHLRRRCPRLRRRRRHRLTYSVLSFSSHAPLSHYLSSRPDRTPPSAPLRTPAAVTSPLRERVRGPWAPPCRPS